MLDRLWVRDCSRSLLFALISSFAIRGYWKFVGECPHRGNMLLTRPFVPLKRPTYRRVQTLRISKKMCKWIAPEGQICGQNSTFWLFWGLYSYICAPINVKVGAAPPQSLNFTFIGTLCRPARRKTHFWPLSKCNRPLCQQACCTAGRPAGKW